MNSKRVFGLYLASEFGRFFRKNCTKELDQLYAVSEWNGLHVSFKYVQKAVYSITFLCVSCFCAHFIFQPPNKTKAHESSSSAYKKQSVVNMPKVVVIIVERLVPSCH